MASAVQLFEMVSCCHTLAKSQNTDVVLIDEPKARKIARVVYGMQVIGSARVLYE